MAFSALNPAMGRRGRPTKVKAMPRKRSMSSSSRESSSSPDRYLYQSNHKRVSDIPMSASGGGNSNRVSLNWVLF